METYRGLAIMATFIVNFPFRTFRITRTIALRKELEPLLALRDTLLKEGVLKEA